MRKYSIVMTVVFSVLFIVFNGHCAEEAKQDTVLRGVVTITNNIKINVEIVSDGEAEIGLSGRSGFDKNMGMIIKARKPKFESSYNHIWMNQMKFSIDIIWIYQGKIVHIVKNALPPNENRFIPIYGLYAGSEISKNYTFDVLEVNAGFVECHGIKTGDTIIVQEIK